MLDALGPAVKALNKHRDEPLEEALKEACDAACKGAEDTKNMIPGAGRSRQYAEKALGHADSGAVSTAILFRAFYEAVSSKCRPPLIESIGIPFSLLNSSGYRKP